MSTLKEVLAVDAERFDRLARVVGAGTTRRGLLAAVAALTPATFLDGTAWGKKKGGKNKKKKACPPCKKRKKGKCKGKKPDGASCPGGTCSGGTCVGSGTCTGSAGNGVSVFAQGQFGGQALQATQTMQPFGAEGQTSSQLAFTLGGAPLLTVETTGAGGVVTVTLTYGGAFSGIQRAQFTNDGSTITGEIDGRAIVPMPSGADPNSATFQDGGPPPNVRVDPKLQAAITAAWQQLGQAAGNCDAASSGVRSASRRNKDVQAQANPENSAGCLALYIPCQTGYVGCLAGAAGCAALLFGAPICVAAVVLACTYAAGVCRRGIRLGSTCCPVKCGGNTDAANPFGEDPGCCEQGETCLDPGSATSPCCPPGTSACGGVCCPSASCLNGSCCESPNKVCGGTCVAPFTPCCGGTTPCNGMCIGNQCCVGGYNCGGFCCQNANRCCNNVCCAPGQVCNAQNQCSTDCPVRCGAAQTCCSLGDCCSGNFCDPFCLR